MLNANKVFKLSSNSKFKPRELKTRFLPEFAQFVCTRLGRIYSEFQVEFKTFSIIEIYFDKL